MSRRAGRCGERQPPPPPGGRRGNNNGDFGPPLPPSRNFYDNNSSSSVRRHETNGAAAAAPDLNFNPHYRRRNGRNNWTNRNNDDGGDNNAIGGGSDGTSEVNNLGRNDDNLRAKLSDLLWNEGYECMICCDRIKRSHSVWSCGHCYCVFHLQCVKKWANSCGGGGNREDAASAPSSTLTNNRGGNHRNRGGGGGGGQNHRNQNPGGGSTPPQTTTTTSEWRCPGCQSVNAAQPSGYECFCGKMRNPNNNQSHYSTSSSYNRHLIPHTCGQLCGKPRARDCPHPCNDPCHPGPCDPCSFTKSKRCLCGRETRRIRCGAEDFQCGRMCEKLFNCGRHQCQIVCHGGECAKCAEKVLQACYCGRCEREVVCGDESMIVVISSSSGSAADAAASTDDDPRGKGENVAGGGFYSCDGVCGKLQSCGIHRCERICHEDQCGRCLLQPELVKTCCCGKMNLDQLNSNDEEGIATQLRNSCQDPLPVCGNVCGKRLPCKDEEEDTGHYCAHPCHPGPCPVCPLNSQVRCRCGSTLKSIPCAERDQFDASHPLLCGRRCTKKRSCKQHKCGEVCCVDTEHFCALICGRKLSCGIHTCDALCHSGKCSPCLQSSFQELTCYCGISVLYPPVACGTKAPACDQLCTRQHACQHPIRHTCHAEPECPPCTFLTEKYCYGKHEVRKNIPCYLTDISCGRPCGRALPCGRHGCVKTCHPGPCWGSEDQEGYCCAQPCLQSSLPCGHPCGKKCHGDTPCPTDDGSLCKFMVTVTCPCGHEVGSMPCYEIDRRASSPSSSRLSPSSTAATSKTELAAGSSSTEDSSTTATNPESKVLLQRQNTVDKHKCLKCTEECARIERNRRFAQALDVKTEDFLGQMGPPPYSDYLKDQTKQNPDLVAKIEKTFCELITVMEKTSQLSRNHPFPSMNRNHRRLVHEYAAFWNVDTIAYDLEPKRNVVATAIKGKSKMPNILLSAAVQKENVKPCCRVLAPKANQMKSTSSTGSANSNSGVGKMETLQPPSAVVSRR